MYNLEYRIYKIRIQRRVLIQVFWSGIKARIVQLVGVQQGTETVTQD